LFEPILEALETRYSFFLLGAGASAGIVPFTRDFRHTIEKDFLNHGGFSANTISRDQVGNRILGDFKTEPSSIKDEIMNRVPQEYIRAKTIQEMVPKKIEKHSHNYRIFNCSTTNPLILFNMNTDGVAKRICKGHCILEPHGFIPYQLVNSDFYNQHLSDLLFYPWLRTFIIPELLLPQSEPKGITNRTEYLKAERWFQYATCFVIIGYSFGKYKDSIDDLETFEFFRYLLRKHPKPVIIIDPNPKWVAAIIQDSTLLREVITIPVLWNHLSSALMEIALRNHCSNILALKSLKKEVKYRYDELCDAGQTVTCARE
jgi:hypothetical protein